MYSVENFMINAQHFKVEKLNRQHFTVAEFKVEHAQVPRRSTAVVCIASGQQGGQQDNGTLPNRV